jgi:hypothetical protein
MIEEAMSITLMIFVLVILLFGFDLTGQVKTRPKHNYGLQQINLVAFKDIARPSHPTKEVVPAVSRVATKIPTHAQ